MFEFLMGEKEIPEEYERNERTAVRAILLYGDKVLMVKTNRGDYKFPGGGVEPGDNLGILEFDSPGRNDWVEREAKVLKYLLMH
jgi:hypothetical protein